MPLYCFVSIFIFLIHHCHGFPEKCTYNEVNNGIQITGNGKLNITFDEPRLKILISGSKIWVYYVICIGPAEVHVSSCPDGQGVVEFFERNEKSKMFELDRGGNLWTGSTSTSAAKLKNAEFYTIYITQLQSDMTFSLLNAKIYVPKEEKDDDKTTAAAMSPAVITIIVLGSLMALITLGIAIFCIWRCCMMKNESHAPSKNATVDKTKASKKIHSTRHVASTTPSSARSNVVKTTAAPARQAKSQQSIQHKQPISSTKSESVSQTVDHRTHVNNAFA